MTVYFRTVSWYYRFWAGRQLCKRGGFSTKRAAQDAEHAHRRTVRDRPAGTRLHFADAVAVYLQDVVAHQVNPRGPRYALLRMVERFPAQRLDQLTPGDVDAYKRWRLATPTVRPHRRVHTPPKGATVNRDLAALSAFYHWCQRKEWVGPGVNPARATLVPRENEPWRPWQTLTPAQETKLWRLLPGRQRIKAQLLLEMGVRKGVVLGLRWDQIDWPHRLAHYTSKRKSGVIPLSGRAFALLQALGPKTTGRVFPERSDTMLRRAWATACADLELPGFRRHDLRVTFARRLAAAGADLKNVMALLGHSTITMTSRYIPSDLQSQRAALARLEASQGYGKGTVSSGVSGKSRTTQAGGRRGVVRQKPSETRGKTGAGART